MGRLLKKYLSGYWFITVLGPVFKFLEAIIELIIPLVVAKIIDVGIEERGDLNYVIIGGVILLVLYILGFACSVTCQYFAAKSSFGFGTNLRRVLYGHINSLPLEDAERLGTPTLLTRLSLDINNVQNALNRIIRLVTRAPFVIIGSLIVAVSINPTLSLAFFATSILLSLSLYLVMKTSAKKLRKINIKHDDVTLLAKENLSGARVIRAFNKQAEEEADFKQTSDGLKRQSVLLGFITALSSPLTFLIVNAALIFLVYAGAFQIQSGNLARGQLIALTQYLMQILNSMLVMALLVNFFTKGAVSAKRINDVLALPTEDESGEDITCFDTDINNIDAKAISNNNVDYKDIKAAICNEINNNTVKAIDNSDNNSESGDCDINSNGNNNNNSESSNCVINSSGNSNCKSGDCDINSSDNNSESGDCDINSSGNSNCKSGDCDINSSDNNNSESGNCDINNSGAKAADSGKNNDKSENCSGKDNAIVFSNVSMSYGGNSGYSLKNISFTLKKGQTLGIIGSTGSGKTTLVNLIAKLYEFEGDIELYGKNLRRLSATSVRNAVSYAPQKAMLFSGTVRDNLLMSNPLATDEEMLFALKAAQCGFVTSLNAVVARGGTNFSGGQRQRLCIARAIVKRTAILVLDDSTSALDYSTEAAVKRQLNKMADVTKIIVTQRVGSIKNADLTIVLENGEAVGVGTHKQLIKSCPIYAEINDIQGATL